MCFENVVMKTICTSYEASTMNLGGELFFLDGLGHMEWCE